MASIIKLKRKSDAAGAPGSLQDGEIAVNLFTRKLYAGNSTGVTAVGGEIFSVTSQTGGEGAYVKVNGETSSNSVLVRGGSAINVGRDANGSISVAHDGTLQTVAIERAALANTNAFIATKLNSSSYTEADVRIKAALANTNAFIATKTTESTALSRLANTNAYIATKTTESTALSRLANTNAYIATKLDSSSYTEADVRIKAALANTNAFIATKTTESTALSRLANTNAYIASTLTSAQNLASARLGATATVQISGDVAGTANFSGNTVNVAVTQQNNSVDLGTHTTGNYVATVSGTANEIEISGSGSETAAVTIGLPDNVTIGNNLTVSGNTHIDGNLTVEGATTYLSTSTVYTDDGMMKLNANNVADVVDSGIYNKFVESATTKYAGYFRDATDGVFKFYNDLEVEPTTTVNTGAAGYALAQLDAIIDGGTY
jgi:hypothetical protein